MFIFLRRVGGTQSKQGASHRTPAPHSHPARRSSGLGEGVGRIAFVAPEDQGSCMNIRTFTENLLVCLVLSYEGGHDSE